MVAETHSASESRAFRDGRINEVAEATVGDAKIVASVVVFHP